MILNRKMHSVISVALTEVMIRSIGKGNFPGRDILVDFSGIRGKKNDCYVAKFSYIITKCML